MNWHPNLYVGEEAAKHKKKLMRKLEKDSIPFGVYVITLAANGKDLLDVIPGFMFMREDIREREVIGLAVTKEEALEVCEQIIMDVYRKTGGFEVRSFFA